MATVTAVLFTIAEPSQPAIWPLLELSLYPPRRIERIRINRPAIVRNNPRNPGTIPGTV